MGDDTEMARKHYSNRRRRRGRFTFLYKLLSILVICAAIIAAMTLFFKVENVEISGEERYTEQEILEASGVSLGDNLYLLNKYTVASSIIQAKPYIEDVRINRKAPNTLLIQVTEGQAAAVIVQGGARWVITAQGKIVEKTADSDLPPVDGCVLVEPKVGERIQLEEENDGTELKALLKAMEEAGLLNQLRGIHLDDAGKVILDYTDRFVVEIPRGADYAAKLYKLNRAIEKLESNETGTFNMSDDEKTFFIPTK